MTEMPIETLLEATLFGAGKTLSISEISESLGYSEQEVSDGLQSLQATMKRRKNGSLRLTQISNKWVMEVKPSIAEHMPKDTKAEIAPKLLKAASIIAYHQPISQSDLVKLMGPKAYDYVRELAQRGMVDRRKDGITRRLTTTRRFSEYFGCPHTERKKVKAWFREMVKDAGLLDGMETAVILEEQTSDPIQQKLPIAEESQD